MSHHFGKAAQFLLSARADIGLKVTSELSGAVTPLFRLVIDQPLKTGRPDWAFQWWPRLSSPSPQGFARWGCQQQPCQIPCSFERQLLADLAIFPMAHTMVASL